MAEKDQTGNVTQEPKSCTFKEYVVYERAGLLEQNVCPTAAMLYRMHHTQRCAYCNLLRQRMDEIDRNLD